MGAAASAALLNSIPTKAPSPRTRRPLSCTVTGLTNGTPYTFTVTATNGVGTGSPSSASALVTPTAASPSSYQGLTPAWLLDTRGLPTIDGEFQGGGPVGDAATLNLHVLGRGGVPSSGVGAVVLNVTVTGPADPGFVTVYPTGVTRPLASSLNFTAGETVPNLVIAQVGTDGQISLYNSSRRHPCVVDVVGWFATGANYTGLTPARLLDTRAGASTVDGQDAGGGALGPGATLDLSVLGRGGVPVVGCGGGGGERHRGDAVGRRVLDRVADRGDARPTASNLNFVAGESSRTW